MSCSTLICVVITGWSGDIYSLLGYKNLAEMLQHSPSLFQPSMISICLLIVFIYFYFNSFWFAITEPLDDKLLRGARLKLSIEPSTPSQHACQCTETSYSLPSCKKMKRVVLHTISFRRKKKGRCRPCKQPLANSCFHAKSWTDRECLVPFRQRRKQNQQVLLLIVIFY